MRKTLEGDSFRDSVGNQIFTEKLLWLAHLSADVDLPTTPYMRTCIGYIVK